MSRFLMFDVKPAPDRVAQYLDTAAALKPEMEASGGCLFIDRFRDLDDPAWLLSFQIWRDEAAVVAWRKNARHHAAQELGRARVFDDYRIRVGDVLEPPGSGKGRYVVFAESPKAPPPLAGARRFSSVYREGEFMAVAGFADLAQAFAAAAPVKGRVGGIDRDYGMFERAEAPQAFPEKARQAPSSR